MAKLQHFISPVTFATVAVDTKIATEEADLGIR
jgi:hypothetical protein